MNYPDWKKIYAEKYADMFIYDRMFPCFEASQSASKSCGNELGKDLQEFDNKYENANFPVQLFVFTQYLCDTHKIDLIDIECLGELILNYHTIAFERGIDWVLQHLKNDPGLLVEVLQHLQDLLESTNIQRKTNTNVIQFPTKEDNT